MTTRHKKIEDLTAAERAIEVKMIQQLLTGALYGSMMQFADAYLHEAALSDPGEPGSRKDYVDVILQDGYRIRFASSIIPPGES